MPNSFCSRANAVLVSAYIFFSSISTVVATPSSAPQTQKGAAPVVEQMPLISTEKSAKEIKLVFGDKQPVGVITVPVASFRDVQTIIAGVLDIRSQTVTTWGVESKGDIVVREFTMTSGDEIASAFERPATSSEEKYFLQEFDKRSSVQNRSTVTKAPAEIGCDSETGCFGAPPLPDDQPAKSQATNCAGLNGQAVTDRPGCRYVRCVALVPPRPAGNCDCDIDCGPFGRCSRPNDIPCGRNGSSTVCCTPPQACFPSSPPGAAGVCSNRPATCPGGGITCSASGYNWCCPTLTTCGSTPMTCRSQPRPTATPRAQPTRRPRPTVRPTRPPVVTPRPTIRPTRPPVQSPQPPVQSPQPPVQSPQPPVQSPEPPVPPTVLPTDTPSTHKKCSPSGYCLSMRGAGNDECSADTDCSHKTCSSGLCNTVPGKGQDECTAHTDCNHKECNSSGYCWPVSGPGQDQCSDNSDCGRKACTVDSLGYAYCGRVSGKGPDECTSSSECGHKGCKERHVAGIGGGSGRKEGFCERLPGLGPDTCNSDSECNHSTCSHGLCSKMPGKGEYACKNSSDCYSAQCSPTSLTCYRQPVPGPDACKSDSDCRHKACDRSSGYCVYVAGTGQDECTSNAECASGHNECDNGSCKRVLGAGSHQCMEDIDCRGANEPVPVPTIEPRAQLKMLSKPQVASASSELKKQTDAVHTDFTKPTYRFENAKAKIEIFQDVTCGMCKYAFNNMFAGLFAEYVSKGLVSLEITEYPLIPREKDLAESRAVICAGEQEKYGAYLDKIYKWDTKAEDRDLTKIAEQASLDLPAFEKCMSSEETAAKLNRNIAEGNRREIKGTPTIILNGTVIGGAMEFARLKDFIDKELQVTK